MEEDINGEKYRFCELYVCVPGGSELCENCIESQKKACHLQFEIDYNENTLPNGRKTT